MVVPTPRLHCCHGVVSRYKYGKKKHANHAHAHYATSYLDCGCSRGSDLLRNDISMVHHTWYAYRVQYVTSYAGEGVGDSHNSSRSGDKIYALLDGAAFSVNHEDMYLHREAGCATNSPFHPRRGLVRYFLCARNTSRRKFVTRSFTC